MKTYKEERPQEIGLKYLEELYMQQLSMKINKNISDLEYKTLRLTHSLKEEQLLKKVFETPIEPNKLNQK